MVDNLQDTVYLPLSDEQPVIRQPSALDPLGKAATAQPEAATSAAGTPLLSKS